MSYSLPRIPYLRLRCTLLAQAPARLPPFHGSLLRGAFGHALRRAVCAMGPEQECASCRLRRACIYPRLFETLLEAGDERPPLLGGVATAPRPYVFEPTGGERFAPGDPLRFDLLLFGQAVGLHAYALLAVERMAPVGLGAGRVPFSLARVEVPGPVGGFQAVFAAGQAVGAVELTPLLTPAEGPSGPRATIHLLTPTQIPAAARPGAAPGFRELAFAMLNRALLIAAVHVPGAGVDWSIQPLLEHAAGVRVIRADVRRVESKRWSNRQRRETPLAGLVGSLEVEGDLAPFGALLRAAEILHIGKGTTFGLGRIAVEE